MKISDDYVYHSLISTRNAYNLLKSSYFTHSATIGFIDNVLEQMQQLLNTYDTADHGDILQFIRTLNELEVYFAHSVPKNHPNEIKILLKETLADLIPDNSANILITQQPNLSYHHRPVPLSFSKSYFIFFCIPLHHKQEVLLNSILYHELGHFYDSLQKPELVRSELIPLNLMPLNENRINILSWVKEFFADYFSIQQGSLACFFSSYEALYNRCFITGRTAVSQTHPNEYYRFKLMELLIKRNNADFLVNTAAGRDFDVFLGECSEKFDQIMLGMDVSFAKEIYDFVINDLLDSFDSKIPSVRLSQNIDDYVQHIIHLIPPNLDVTLSPVNLLVTGWIAYYFHREEIAARSGLDPEDLSAVRRIINNLVHKGIRNLYNVRIWRESL